MSDAPALPQPLTPADCDLSAYDWFPLKFKRLTRSTWWIRASDRAKALNIDLWCAAYQEVPAASLPDDDVALSDLAGFGRRDISAWLEVKAEVLACWTLCADGRWYHPTLAEVACEAWTSRLEAIQRREADRERKQLKRGGGNPEASEGSPDLSGGRPTDVPQTGGGNPSEIALKGQDKTGDREADASLSPREGADGGGAGEALLRDVQKLYAELVIKGRGSPMQARAAWLRLSEADGRNVPAAIRAYAQVRPWGSNGPPALQRFLGEDIWREFVPSASVTSIVWRGPADLRAAVLGEMGEPFVRSYLDPAEWRADGRQPVIVPLNTHAAARLRTVRALASVAIQDPVLPRRTA